MPKLFANKITAGIYGNSKLLCPLGYHYTVSDGCCCCSTVCDYLIACLGLPQGLSCFWLQLPLPLKLIRSNTLAKLPTEDKTIAATLAALQWELSDWAQSNFKVFFDKNAQPAAVSFLLTFNTKIHFNFLTSTLAYFHTHYCQFWELKM